MARKTSKKFKELIMHLPGISAWEDFWIVYCEGYEDGKKKAERGK